MSVPERAWASSYFSYFRTKVYARRDAGRATRDFDTLFESDIDLHFVYSRRKGQSYDMIGFRTPETVGPIGTF